MPKRKETISSLRKKAWKIFSTYIRLRDSDKDGMAQCSTCNIILPAFGTGKMAAGHFIGQKMCPALVFDEDNVHIQCSRCNGPGMGMQYAMGRYIDGAVGGDVNTSPAYNLYCTYLDYKDKKKSFNWSTNYLRDIICLYGSHVELMLEDKSFTIEKGRIKRPGEEVKE